MSTREAVGIRFQGGEILMLPTFKAMRRIEDAEGPVLFLYQLHQGGKLNLRTLATIVATTHAAHEDREFDDANVERMMEWIYEAGVASDEFREAIHEILLGFLYTPEQLAKKRQAEADEKDALLQQMIEQMPMSSFT